MVSNVLAWLKAQYAYAPGHFWFGGAIIAAFSIPAILHWGFGINGN